ncbi:MAG: uroporphyrinogen-III C-methyltransferase [SAR324 cluster bacterium]|nr:uroporphyrinogen-III C-methyltransferase [SAR324 cluster bacterium]
MAEPRSKVYLVGAGPGDPELLTLKAQNLLQQCDVVIYDALVHESILERIPAHVEMIHAGKHQKNHTIPQDQLNQLLVAKAKEGKCVVRLKGGDPFVFGRGGEELQEIAKAGISFEVVPGITSAIAAPAYAGIPLTHRHYSSNVALLTGVEHQDTFNKVDWAAVSRMGTIVVMMGNMRLETIVKELLLHGKSPATPVAVVQQGTWPTQQTIDGTLENIVSRIQCASELLPALVIIGEVCELRQSLAWVENKPLFGQCVLTTRQESGENSLSEKLKQAGASVKCYPMIAIQEPDSWDAFDKLVESGELVDWVIFSSANAVHCCLGRLRHLGRDSRFFGNMKIACVGLATARALQPYGLTADVVPDHYQGEGLIENLKDHDMQNKKVWLPKAREGRDLVLQALRQWGATVIETTVYQTLMPDTDFAPLLDRLKKEKFDWLSFASPSAVKNLMGMLPPDMLLQMQKNPPLIACIGETTATAVKKFDLPVTVQPQIQDFDGMVNAMCEYVAAHSQTLRIPEIESC